jgi:anaerobic selenocysteine-containing dehydrogenase
MTTSTQDKLFVPGYCALCVSRCGSIATVENGKFVHLSPDPGHPTGKALCIKGKVAPELVYSPHRLRKPLKRSRPKGESDPGWLPISWDEALHTVAERLSEIRDKYGPESVVFASASPSTAATSDVIPWIQRLQHAYGSPNYLTSMELCGWGRYLASIYTFGASVPGAYMPDIDNAGCILYWGYNPTVARIAHATSTAAALKRGARLVVVDPRNVGAARQADEWLRVRPGTDGALALAIAGMMIERGWYDRDFVREWTNAPLLVRADNGRFLTAADLGKAGSAVNYIGWDKRKRVPLIYDPGSRSFSPSDGEPALFGEFEIAATNGLVKCATSFELTRRLCARYVSENIGETCGVPLEQIERTARLLWESRPVAYYSWSGLEQHTNTTQTIRAINLLYALTGDLDRRGGNVLFPAVPSNEIAGQDLLSEEQRKKSLGLTARPLGPAKWGFTSAGELYTAALEESPRKARGLVSFGANILMSNADSARGRRALAALDFHVHTDLFMNPTSELADIVLPAASPFETETLKIGFDLSEEAQSLVQLRRPVVEPQGECRSDRDIIFDLAVRLGLGEHFWDGDTDAAYRYQLAPSGLSLEDLRHSPGGLKVPLKTRYRKFAEVADGKPRGFNTPSGRIELYCEPLLHGGYDPLPEFREPFVSPRQSDEIGKKFPLVMTSSKGTLYCESQHRGLPSLRRRAMDPEIEIHPETASERRIAEGDWVTIATPHGSVSARAKFNDKLDPEVVCGQHGWWQACPELQAPGYDPFTGDGANYNLLISQEQVDPISGSTPLRSFACQITKRSAAMGKNG